VQPLISESGQIVVLFYISTTEARRGSLIWKYLVTVIKIKCKHRRLFVDCSVDRSKNLQSTTLLVDKSRQRTSLFGRRELCVWMCVYVCVCVYFVRVNYARALHEDLRIKQNLNRDCDSLRERNIVRLLCFYPISSFSSLNTACRIS